MEISRNGSRPSSPGPVENFTGAVRRDPLFGAHPPSRMVGGVATFEAGARNVWHTHPVGQILIYTSGVGRVQTWSGPIETVYPGDVIWFAPGEKHWHGASPSVAASHIALVETDKNGETAVWMESVTDTQYAGEE